MREGGAGLVVPAEVVVVLVARTAEALEIRVVGLEEVAVEVLASAGGWGEDAASQGKVSGGGGTWRHVCRLLLVESKLYSFFFFFFL